MDALIESCLDEAVVIHSNMQGSSTITSMGALYYQVPSWPLGKSLEPYAYLRGLFTQVPATLLKTLRLSCQGILKKSDSGNVGKYVLR